LPSATPDIVQAFADVGILSVQTVLERSASELADNAGISVDITAQLLDEAQDVMDVHRQQYADSIEIPFEDTGVDLATFVAEPASPQLASFAELPAPENAGADSASPVR
jgi:hypothetical protein